MVCVFSFLLCCMFAGVCCLSCVMYCALLMCLLLVSCDAFGVVRVMLVVCYLFVDDRCVLFVAFLVCGLLDSDGC